MGSIKSLSLALFLLLAGCHTLGESDDAGAINANSSSGGVYGNLPGDDGDGSDDNDDGGGATSDGGTSDGGTTGTGGTSDGGTTGDGGSASDGGTSDGDSTGDDKATAEIMIFPIAEWEASIDPDDMATPCPSVAMYGTANVTEGDWSAYSADTPAYVTDGDCGPTYDVVTYTPGNILAVGAVWSNYYNNEYYADVPGVGVRAEEYDWDGNGTTEKVVVVIFEDDTYDVLEIDDSGADTSEAWYNDSAAGAEVYLQTPEDTTGEYSL